MHADTLFSQPHWRTLNALADTVIPEDDYPSATQADVGIYLQRLFSRELKSQLPIFCLCLQLLDEEAVLLYAKGFAELSLSEREELLSKLEKGENGTTWPMPPSHFLHRIYHLVAEGYYSDPGNGGNKNGLAWKMIGFEVTA